MEKHWRKLAGNVMMFDTMGASQFALTTLFFGLREKHKLLEIGSGPMRAGRFLIMYLDEGNYFGVEPNQEATDKGLANELGAELTKLRKPTITSRTDFGIHDLGVEFDYALSYSVLTHCPPGDIAKLFNNLSKCFHSQSIFLGTAVFAEGKEEIADFDNWTNIPFNRYSYERIQFEAQQAGFQIARLGAAFQDWFCVYYEGNQVAERGIAQANKVDFRSVLPAWESPKGWCANHPWSKAG